MRGLKGGKTSANKAAASSSTSSSSHAGARSASHGTSKALGVGVDPLAADEMKVSQF
jgi:hypothetical protein